MLTVPTTDCTGTTSTGPSDASAVIVTSALMPGRNPLSCPGSIVTKVL